MAPKTDQKIRRLLQPKPFLLSTEIKTSVPELADLPTTTIRHRLNKYVKLLAQKPLKKPVPTPKMAKKRLKFCNHYKSWTSENWQIVMFSDESTFLACHLQVLRPKSCWLIANDLTIRSNNCQAPSFCCVLGVLFQPGSGWSVFLT